MKDSKQVRSEYQSFVESYSSIAAKGAEEAKATEMKKKPAKKDDDCECKHEMVLMRKSGAFTELAEKYQMSVKQFARFVENNQGLFDIETRKKAILANKFSGFKESVEWDEFFGDLELKEGPEEYAGGQHPSKHPDKKVRDKYETQTRRATAPKGVGVPDKSVGYGQLKQSHELEGEELQEVTTKETAAGTKYKVRVKEKESGSSYIRYATREKIAQLRADPKIASVEMTDEGDAPEDKGEKKAQEKGGGLAVKAKKKREKEAKEREAVAKPAKPAKRSVTTEGMDPVGKEDADIDNDGDTDKSDEYLHKRRKAIGKAIKKRGTKKESFSNWRDELRETVGGDKVPTKLKNEKTPSGPVKNKVIINPPMGEDFDPQKVAEALGAELVDCQEEEKWIQSAIKKPGSLKKELGVPEDEKIPASKLNAAAKKGGKLGQRARLAKTLRGLNKESVDCEEQVKPQFQGSSGFDRFMRPVERAVDNSPQRTRAREGLKNRSSSESPNPQGTADMRQPESQGTADIVKPKTSSTPSPGSRPNPRKPRSEAVESGPILPGEKGKRIFPKDQQPKPTGAKLPPIQKAGFEPEGDQLQENPIAVGAALGLGAGGLYLMNKLRQDKKKSDQGKGSGGLVDRLNKRRKELEGM